MGAYNTSDTTVKDRKTQ